MQRLMACHGSRPMIRRATALPALALALLVVLALGPQPARAQIAEITRQCAFALTTDARQFCNLVAHGVDILQPRLGLAAAAGNPVPGTASTIGLRVGYLPRFGVAARGTSVWVRLPPIRRYETTRPIRFVLPALAIDGVLGVYDGFAPLPGVGGIGSVDLLAGMGLLFPPTGQGFVRDGGVGSLAIGTRLGLLRESFILPGISLTAMYRRIGEVEFGDRQQPPPDAFFSISGLSDFGLRGAISKRILTVGATAGMGWDRYASNVFFRVAEPTGPQHSFASRVNGFTTSRYNAFANLSWTMLILHAVGELGWQSGGDRMNVDLPPGNNADSPGTLFGSLALRLTI
jgi:hypothetical protein